MTWNTIYGIWTLELLTERYIPIVVGAPVGDAVGEAVGEAVGPVGEAVGSVPR